MLGPLLCDGNARFRTLAIGTFDPHQAVGRKYLSEWFNIKEELTMTRIKFLGLAIGASLLLFGSAEATPMAPAPLSTIEATTGNFVVQARVHHGVAVRTTRRHVRRGYYWTDVVTLKHPVNVSAESAQSDGITPKADIALHHRNVRIWPCALVRWRNRTRHAKGKKMTAYKAMDRFDVVDNEGEKYTVVELLQRSIFRRARRHVLLSGEKVNRLKDGTFQIFETGKILRKVS
jgi:hypothetical protein